MVLDTLGSTIPHENTCSERKRSQIATGNCMMMSLEKISLRTSDFRMPDAENE
jgi:hypothetical protein